MRRSPVFKRRTNTVYNFLFLNNWIWKNFSRTDSFLVAKLACKKTIKESQGMCNLAGWFCVYMECFNISPHISYLALWSADAKHFEIVWKFCSFPECLVNIQHNTSILIVDKCGKRGPAVSVLALRKMFRPHELRREDTFGRHLAKRCVFGKRWKITLLYQRLEEPRNKKNKREDNSCDSVMNDFSLTEWRTREKSLKDN